MKRKFPLKQKIYVARKNTIKENLAEKLRKANCEIKSVNGWWYKDLHEVTIDELKPHYSSNKHLVLYANGIPRFTLEFEKTEKEIKLLSIQRTRTQYKKTLNGIVFDKEKEKAETDKLKESLGMHPAELLFSYFIFMNKEEILKGKQIVFTIGKNDPLYKVYAPIIERFFDSGKKIMFDVYLFKLNLNKKRVKEILMF